MARFSLRRMLLPGGRGTSLLPVAQVNPVPEALPAIDAEAVRNDLAAVAAGDYPDLAEQVETAQRELDETVLPAAEEHASLREQAITAVRSGEAAQQQAKEGLRQSAVGARESIRTLEGERAEKIGTLRERARQARIPLGEFTPDEVTQDWFSNRIGEAIGLGPAPENPDKLAEEPTKFGRFVRGLAKAVPAALKFVLAFPFGWFFIFSILIGFGLMRVVELRRFNAEDWRFWLVLFGGPVVSLTFGWVVENIREAELRFRMRVPGAEMPDKSASLVWRLGLVVIWAIEGWAIAVLLSERAARESRYVETQVDLGQLAIGLVAAGAASMFYYGLRLMMLQVRLMNERRAVRERRRMAELRQSWRNAMVAWRTRLDQYETGKVALQECRQLIDRVEDINQELGVLNERFEDAVKRFNEFQAQPVGISDELYARLDQARIRFERGLGVVTRVVRTFQSRERGRMGDDVVTSEEEAPGPGESGGTGDALRDYESQLAGPSEEEPRG